MKGNIDAGLIDAAGGKSSVGLMNSIHRQGCTQDKKFWSFDFILFLLSKF